MFQAHDWILLILSLIAIGVFWRIQRLIEKGRFSMADESQYPKRWSDIEITFLDGEVITHRCSFGSHFAPHLAKQSGETGILTPLCGPKTYSYPLTSIRGWTISQLPGEGK